MLLVHVRNNFLNKSRIANLFVFWKIYIRICLKLFTLLYKIIHDCYGIRRVAKHNKKCFYFLFSPTFYRICSFFTWITLSLFILLCTTWIVCYDNVKRIRFFLAQANFILTPIFWIDSRFTFTNIII